MSEPCSPDHPRIEHALFASAERCPLRTAVVDGDSCFSYEELARWVETFAGTVRSAGVSNGDRVALYLDKTVESVVALYGVWAAGAVAVPVNEGLRSIQVRHILQDSGSRLAITTARKASRLDPGTFDGVDLVEVQGPPRRIPLGTTRARDAGAGGATPATILYTSGSTGKPKGIAISHDNLVAGSRIVTGYLQMKPDDRVLSVLPFSFDYGLNQLLDTVRLGATICLQRSHFSPDICRALGHHRITVLAGVPSLWIQLMSRLSPFPASLFPSLRTLTNSGGVFPTELVARYRRHLPHARLFLMYGLSEAFRSTYLPPEFVDHMPGSMGKAIPETDIYVVDDEGRECPPNAPGELVHRGPTVALGYWRNPEATALRFRPNPLARDSGETVVYSGDLVKKDAGGFLYFVGRRDQMIKTQGFRVSPEEVEEIVYASGLVSEAVARGVPDAELGAAIVIHVVAKSPDTFSKEQLMAFCRREMPTYMVPKSIEIHATLPRTSSGKVDRMAVAP